MEREIELGAAYYMLVSKEVVERLEEKSPKLALLLEELEDVFPKDLPPGSPPIRDIEHQIHLIPRAPFKKIIYRANPYETKELQRQIGELVVRGHT